MRCTGAYSATWTDGNTRGIGDLRSVGSWASVFSYIECHFQYAMAPHFRFRSLFLCVIIATWFCPLPSLTLPAAPADPLTALPSGSISAPNVTSDTNTELDCVTHKDWVGHGMLELDCRLAINTFYAHISRIQHNEYEFIDVDTKPETHDFIKTPLKFTSGTSIWPC